MASPIKKFLEQTAIYGLSSIVGRLLNFLLVPLYTRLFSSAEYGIVTDLYAYAGFFLVLLTYGMETAFFRFAKNEKQSRDKTFTTAVSSLMLTTGIFLILILSFSGNIADLLMYPQHQRYVIWFALIISLDVLSAIPFAKLRAENKALKFATFKFINIGLNIGFNLFFLVLCPYLLSKNPHSFVAAFYNPNMGIGYIFISNLIAGAVTALLFIPDLLRVKYSFSPALLKKLLIYGSPLLFAGLAGMVNEVIDRILLKYLSTIPEGTENATEYVLSQIGIYGANYKLAILMTLFIQAFRYAAEPFFFSQKNEKNAKEIYARIMKYFVVFGLFIFLGIMLFLDIARHFIDSSYWEGLKIVPVLLIANLFLGIVYNLSVWFKLTDRTQYGAYIAGTGAVITIVLNIILIPRIGYLGSAWATFYCYFGMMTLSYFLGRKYYPVPYSLKSIAVYLISALALWGISEYIEIQGNAKYIINLLLLSGFIVLFVLKENLIKEIKQVLKK